MIPEDNYNDSDYSFLKLDLVSSSKNYYALRVKSAAVTLMGQNVI